MRGIWDEKNFVTEVFLGGVTKDGSISKPS